MKPCACVENHAPRRIVLTGGPGAGKTAVLELIRHAYCQHVKVLLESASIVFGGGFPRSAANEARRAAQRAIYFVQRELEIASAGDNAAILLCDRGTVDGAAYWPGPGELWSQVGTSLEAELRRYDAVIHLRTPTAARGYGHQNPLRIESAEEAAAIDVRLERIWAAHPRRHVIEATSDFMVKAARALQIVREEMPLCCRNHVATVPEEGSVRAR